MSEQNREAPAVSTKSLESRYKQMFKYLYVALACILVGVGATFLYMNQLKSNEQVAITNAQTQATAAKDSSICKVYPTEDQCQLANQIASNPTTPVNGKDGQNGQNGANGTNGVNGQNGTNGTDGKDGKGISNVEINADGHLIISYTDDTNKDVGRVVGHDGATGSAGANGTAGKDGTAGTNGTNGRSVQSTMITDGHLIVTFSDGTTQDAGIVTGPSGPDKFVRNISTDASGSVTITYNDNTTASAGKIVFPATVKSVSCSNNTLILTFTDGTQQTAPVVCTPSIIP